MKNGIERVSGARSLIALMDESAEGSNAEVRWGYARKPHFD
jgi:hypothetical protein